MFNQWCLFASPKKILVILLVSCLSLFLFPQTEVFANSEHPLDAAYQQALLAEREGRFIEALNQLKDLANKGHPGAQYYYGYMMDKANNDELAVEMFTRSADQNYIKGILSLAKMYSIGEGVEQDLLKSKALYEKAIGLDSFDAMRIYAYAYQNGDLTLDKDVDKAFEWFKKAAELGDIKSIIHLAKSFEKGLYGFNKDPNEALQWFLKGAELNDKYAISRLIKTYKQGDLGQKVDKEKASVWQLKLETSK